jgi:epoxide hydrolase-like protein
VTGFDDGSRRRFLKAVPMLGLAAAFSPGTIGTAFAATTKKEGTMTPTAATQELAAGVRPFQVDYPEAVLTDLKKRVNATRWPQRETVKDTTQGVQLETIRSLASYWGKDYDWKKGEAKLKAVPHFMTEIDGLDIHFIHVRSKHENAMPVIITHGWPGSIVEQLKIIDPLTNPTAHGGTAADAFDAVAAVIMDAAARAQVVTDAGSK